MLLPMGDHLLACSPHGSGQRHPRAEQRTKPVQDHQGITLGVSTAHGGTPTETLNGDRMDPSW